MRTVPREPWRGSQICGWQIAYGLPWSIFCAERKGEGMYLCPEHWQEWVEEGGYPRFAQGNALGDPSAPVRLLWEPYGGSEPLEPTEDELARYAGAQTGGE